MRQKFWNNNLEQQLVTIGKKFPYVLRSLVLTASIITQKNSTNRVGDIPNEAVNSLITLFLPCFKTFGGILLLFGIAFVINKTLLIHQSTSEISFQESRKNLKFAIGELFRDCDTQATWNVLGNCLNKKLITSHILIFSRNCRTCFSFRVYLNLDREETQANEGEACPIITNHEAP